jgi:large conductance mechanosensitive channel
MLKEFRAFVLRGNVVDLAVGVVIGAAFTGIVNSLVTGMLNPLVGVFGDTGLEELSFTITRVREIDGVPKNVDSVFAYGAVLDALVQFLLIAAVVFFAVVKPLNHLVARVRVDEDTPAVTRQCPECLGEIPTAARRCRFCTSVVPA